MPRLLCHHRQTPSRSALANVDNAFIGWTEDWRQELVQQGRVQPPLLPYARPLCGPRRQGDRTTYSTRMEATDARR